MNLPIDAITVTDLFDKVVVAVLVYLLSMGFRREIATRLMGLTAALFVLKSLAHLLGLATTEGLFSVLLASMPIILAVIFQSDIRRTLFSFWKRSRPEELNHNDLTTTVDELCKGLHQLAERRIGALIVIVRQMAIDHLVQVGTEIDAKVTSELLNSIFLPYSPIHDGAVIIQREKITSAGCFLPLSENPDIAKSFGTRHRAALGISELADALVLVVSEETGKISIVHDGKINYDADPAEIRRLSRKAIEGKRALRTQPVTEH